MATTPRNGAATRVSESCWRTTQRRPVEVVLGTLLSDLGEPDAGPGQLELCVRLRETGPQVGVVQRDEELSGLDRVALVGSERADAPEHLRGDGRSIPVDVGVVRGHVAAQIPPAPLADAWTGQDGRGRSRVRPCSSGNSE